MPKIKLMFPQLKSKCYILLLSMVVIFSMQFNAAMANHILISNEMKLNNDPKPIIIQMLPQAAEIIYSTIDLKYEISVMDGKNGFIISYLTGGKQHDVVKYFDVQFTSEAQTSKAATLIISKLKQDLPLEIKGTELTSIFN